MDYKNYSRKVFTIKGGQLDNSTLHMNLNIISCNICLDDTMEKAGGNSSNPSMKRASSEFDDLGSDLS